MKERMIPMLLVFATIVALVLNSRGQLIAGAGKPSVVNVLFSQDGYKLGDAKSFGTWGLAFFAYILAVSVMSDKEAEWLTLALVLGALAWNQKSNPGASVIDVLFGGASGKAGASQIDIPYPSGSGTAPVTVSPPGS